MLLFERKSSAWLALSLFLLLATAPPQYFALAAPPAIVWFIYFEFRLMFGLAMLTIAAIAVDKLEPAYQNGFAVTQFALRFGLAADSALGPILGSWW